MVFHVLNRFAVEQDEHFLAVARYVERNALRANLVARAEEWRWSSLCRRCCGTAEQKAILAAWPLEIPHDWLERVNRADNEKELKAMRRSVQRGRAYGAHIRLKPARVWRTIADSWPRPWPLPPRGSCRPAGKRGSWPCS